MNAVKNIRKNIFKVTQSEFSKIAGVSQAAVSRWESGVAPSLEEMKAIRSAAIERNLDWSDVYFFEPGAIEASGEVATADGEVS